MKKILFLFFVVLATVASAQHPLVVKIQDGDSPWKILKKIGVQDPLVYVNDNQTAVDAVIEANNLSTWFDTTGGKNWLMAGPIYTGRNLIIPVSVMRLLGEDKEWVISPDGKFMPNPESTTTSEVAPVFVENEAGNFWAVVAFIGIGLGLIALGVLIFIVLKWGPEWTASASERKRASIIAQRQQGIANGTLTPETAGPPMDEAGVTYENINHHMQRTQRKIGNDYREVENSRRLVLVTSRPGWKFVMEYRDGVDVPVPLISREAWTAIFRHNSGSPDVVGILLTGCANSVCVAIHNDGRREFAQAGVHFDAIPQLQPTADKLGPILAELRQVNGGELPAEVVVNEVRIVFNPPVPTPTETVSTPAVN